MSRKAARYLTTDTAVNDTDGPTIFNNLIGLYGTVPRIDNLTSSTPTYTEEAFGATTGSTLSYTLDQQADVTIELRSLSSGQVLSTWSLPAQIAGAHVNAHLLCRTRHNA